MSDSCQSTRPSASEAGSGAVYAPGIIGALVFFCSGPTRRRMLAGPDAALVVEATRGESEPGLWGALPAGPYTLKQAQAAMAAWTPEHDQVSYGMIRAGRLLAALGLMLDGSDSAELAYWVRPEQRRRGITSKGGAPRHRLGTLSGPHPALAGDRSGQRGVAAGRR
jgi:hypothetical protein